MFGIVESKFVLIASSFPHTNPSVTETGLSIDVFKLTVSTIQPLAFLTTFSPVKAAPNSKCCDFATLMLALSVGSLFQILFICVLLVVLSCVTGLLNNPVKK